MPMRSFSRFCFRTGILLPLIALVSIGSGFALFGWGVTPTHKALARGLTYGRLSRLQKRMLSGLVTSELASPQGSRIPHTVTTTRF